MERPTVWAAEVGMDCEGVNRVFARLQDGYNAHDTAQQDRQIAQDVVWGSPFGEIVEGFDQLYTIHRDMKKGDVTGDARSRYIVESTVFLGPDVAVARVRREGLDANGTAFATPAATEPKIVHELAMYVLVKRDGAWWIAAAQNTPIRESRLEPPRFGGHRDMPQSEPERDKCSTCY